MTMLSATCSGQRQGLIPWSSANLKYLDKSKMLTQQHPSEATPGHWSFAVGKRVRSETGIGEGAVSVSYAAISLAKKIFGTLKGLRALLVGAGEMAELTATHLRSQDVEQILVASRTPARAAVLAAKVAGDSVPWERLETELGEADIVVTATGSVQPIVTRQHRFESIRQSEINRVKSKLASTSSTSHERVEEIIEEVTHRIVEKLLLQPTEQLKAVTDEKLIAAYTEAVNHLFNLVEESDEIDTEKAFPPTRPLVAPPRAR